MVIDVATFIEREIKLSFPSTASAREAVDSLGASSIRTRRLQDDRLLDWPDGRLQQSQCVLRVREDTHSARLTFKGPPKISEVKAREEFETPIGDSALLLIILERLGLQVWFRYQKYRAEFEHNGVIIAIDETPIGTFLELEGNENNILKTVQSMGHTREEYVLDSYRSLFVKNRSKRNLDIKHMLFQIKP